MIQVFTEIKTLYTPKQRKKTLAKITEAAMVVEDGFILWVGKQTRLPAKFKRLKKTALNIQTLLPGFIDCHTHTVFSGNRHDEFELRNTGVSYQTIAKKGGGIAKTVKSTRKSSAEELLQLAEERCQRFLQQGITTVEIKSGYGLDKKAELKMLDVINQIKTLRTIPTFLGLHSIPKNNKGSYFEEVLTWLPEVAQRCRRADIFIEKGYFTPAQARRFFTELESFGFDFLAHCEQLSQSKGIDVALESQALSVDHCVNADSRQIKKIAKSDTVAVLLPTSDFYLKIAYPPARQMLDAGANVALATDYNPGSSPSQSINFTGVLARLQMQMKLQEVVQAMTLSAAKALGLQDLVGSLEVGKIADFVGFDCEFNQLFYEVGYHPVRFVYQKGKRSFINKNT